MKRGRPLLLLSLGGKCLRAERPMIGVTLAGACEPSSVCPPYTSARVVIACACVCVCVCFGDWRRAVVRGE